MRLVTDLSRLDKVLQKQRNRKKNIEEKVSRIIKDVKEHGDESLLEYTRRFDKVRLTQKNLRVTESEISAAFHDLNSEIISALKVGIDNVFKFYRGQQVKSYRHRDDNGKVLAVRYIPLERVGVYIPAGTAPLVSTVYMTVIPALVAGVQEIVLVSPPSKEGFVNPFILAVAAMLKIKEIYKAGGAQAIAALAFGTKTIRRVDKIVGPGNEFVTEAKRQVFGEVDIDMLAGPSEVVIIAGKDSNVEYIIADLEAQMEHHRGLGIVITNSQRLISELKKSRLDALIIKVRNLDEAVDVSNRICPEHLEIFTQSPSSVLQKVKNSGAVFLGEWSPAAMGDYTAGPSHVLPTGGRARFSSALSVRDFMKEIHIISYTRRALVEEAVYLEKIAALEGMQKHILSVRKRLGT